MNIKHIIIYLLTLWLIFGIACKSSEPAFPTTPEEQPVETGLEEPSPDLPVTEKPEEISHTDVDSLLQEMSLRQKIGQLFFIPVNGTFRNQYDQRYLEWKRLIDRYQVGGLIFMAGDIYGQAVMTRELQQRSEIPLWITQDMEFGAAMRVQGTTRFTPAMGIAATRNPQNAYLKGKITAREAKALGVHQIFGPVLDVNNNPENPVINVRSFSADPEMVAEFGNAFIRGVEEEGLLATAKHFPGHGDTDTDSHLALPVMHHNYERLKSIELRPFQIAIESGLRSIMSAHIAFPNISSNPELPGTLDPEILNGILSDSLGFDGLIVTDGLEMQGITNTFSPGEAVIRSLSAGADVMLISPDEMTAIHEVEMAVKHGRLSEERIEQSVRKILNLKKENGLFENPLPDIHALDYKINTPEHRKISNRIARESVTVLKNENEILPIREIDNQRIVVVSVADDHSGSTGNNLAREMRKYHSNVVFHALDRRTGEEEKENILSDAMNADLLVIGSFIFVRSHQPMQLTDDQLSFLRKLEKLDQPSVLIAFGNPYVLQELKDTDAHILAWSGSSHQVINTVPALFGGSNIAGRIPVDIPGLYDPGDGIEMPHSVIRFDSPETVGFRTDSLMRIDDIMQSAIEDSIFPGGVVTVLKDGVIAWNKGYGYHDYTKTRAVRSNDVYDLASITKVVATTTAIMKLHEEGKISLDDPVSRYIPEYDAPVKSDVTIRHLLLHTSGLPAFRIYVDRLQSRSELIRAVRDEPLENAPGEEYVYSDLGFILLAEIVREVSGQEIDRFIRNQFFNPLRMSSTHFNPGRLGIWMRNRIPPTEIDIIYGRGTVQGYAHDERAYFMDGVAGHAGLFATGEDLGIFSQMLLNKGFYAGKTYLQPATIELFTGHRSPINQRAYGFDRKSEDYTSAGSLLGPNSFGHTGFTGTSIWIDPDSGISIILLTNRTYPNRSYGTEIRQIRPEIADTVMRSLAEP